MNRIVVFLACVLTSMSSVRAQSLRFQVVSVKRSTPGSPASFQTTTGGLTVRSYSLQFLIPYAYKIAVYQISGAPTWLADEKYDVTAKSPDGTIVDQLPYMLQNVLEARFGLSFHRETKELPVYALQVAGSSKLTVEKRDKQQGDGRLGAGRGRAAGHMVTSSELSELLSLLLDHPVLDRTGIDGRFNFSLQWTPDETERPVGPPSANETAAIDSRGVTLLNAVQEQLGLKLVRQKAPVELFIIDRVERVPTEN